MYHYGVSVDDTKESPMASITDIKNGAVLKIDGNLWSVVEFQHVKPGKGGAFVRTKLRNVTSGKVVANYWLSQVYSALRSKPQPLTAPTTSTCTRTATTTSSWT